MPTHKGIEVWIEDSKHLKLNPREVTINLVDADDRTVTAKTEMWRDEVGGHCQLINVLFSNTTHRYSSTLFTASLRCR